MSSLRILSLMLVAFLAAGCGAGEPVIDCDPSACEETPPPSFSDDIDRDDGDDACAPGTVDSGHGCEPIACDEDSFLFEGRCVVRCEVPRAPVLDVIAEDEELAFTIEGGGDIEIAILGAEEALEAAAFMLGAELSLAGQSGPIRVLARSADPDCESEILFDARMDVRPTYPPPAGEPGSTAIAVDDPRIVAWATNHGSVIFGEGVDPEAQVPAHALGAPDDALVSLGHGGSIVLTFERPIENREGYDLVVFENAFDDTFLEIAFVEVSSDGVHFTRFDSAWRGTGPIPAFGRTNTTVLGGLAGKYRAGWGTPFDLATLANTPEVRTGVLDLGSVTHVRIVDVVGDGSTTDSFGRPIYAPYPAMHTAGFDLDAVGVIHERTP